MKKCLYCVEEIKSEAIKCKHCGEFFSKIPKSIKQRFFFKYVTKYILIESIIFNFISAFLYNIFIGDDLEWAFLILLIFSIIALAKDVYNRLQIIGSNRALTLLVFVPIVNIFLYLYLLFVSEKFSEKDYNDFKNNEEYQKTRKQDSIENEIAKSKPKSKVDLDVIDDFCYLNKGLKIKDFELCWDNGRIIEIEIRNNKKLKIIPDSILNLSSLGFLFLFDNDIEIIPENISKLEELYAIDVSCNNIKKIPELIIGNNISETITLSSNKIKEIPCNFLNSIKSHFAFPNITLYLILNGNKITNIQEIPDNSTNIIIVDDEIERIEDVVEKFGDLSSNGYYEMLIDLSYNKITEIPVSFINFNKITKIYIVDK